MVKRARSAAASHRPRKARRSDFVEALGDMLSPRSTFFHRLTTNLALALCLVAASLAVGMAGYHLLGGLGWVDAFLNAAMILSGMGPVDALAAPAAKVFAGCYALYSGLALIAASGLIIAPILHRFLHRFHLEDSNDEE